jgi:hypothetical protein
MKSNRSALKIVGPKKIVSSIQSIHLTAPLKNRPAGYEILAAYPDTPKTVIPTPNKPTILAAGEAFSFTIEATQGEVEVNLVASGWPGDEDEETPAVQKILLGSLGEKILDRYHLDYEEPETSACRKLTCSFTADGNLTCNGNGAICTRKLAKSGLYVFFKVGKDVEVTITSETI